MSQPGHDLVSFECQYRHKLVIIYQCQTNQHNLVSYECQYRHKLVINTNTQGMIFVVSNTTKLLLIVESKQSLNQLTFFNIFCQKLTGIDVVTVPTMLSIPHD